MKKLIVGDSIIVIAGKYRGRKAEIVSFSSDGLRVFLSGITDRVVHRKVQDSSGRLMVPVPVHYSNVLFCNEAGSSKRTSFLIDSSGKKSRIRKN
jgi:ribosomal protein L24